jgi:hypothetical protein
VTTSLLKELIERQTRESVVTVLARQTDHWAEAMMHEMLQDPAFKAQMRTLLSAAFAKALAELEQPPTP